MRKVGVVINTDKPVAVEAAGKLITWLEARSFVPLLAPLGAASVDRPDLAVPEGARWSGCDMLIVLGGDGTLIRAAQSVAPMGVPVLGVNTGHLGFLTELEGAELFDHLEPILAGEYHVEERLMLSVRLERPDHHMELTALNDAVISKGPRARMVQLGVSVDETTVAQYRADGVIIATPTGSTAYSLSAGGPIVGPTVDVLLVTPICPHTVASSRTIVVSGGEEVTVTVMESPGEVGLSADGSEPIPLYPGDRVRISRAPFTAKLVRRRTYRFYDVLRQKLADPGR